MTKQNNNVEKIIKQYVKEEAYTDNIAYNFYENGILVNREIVSIYEMDGFDNAIEMLGYEQAFDMNKEEKSFEEAKRNYEYAIKQYEWAKKHPLFIPKNE